jgi:hypothetical protein
MMLLKAGTTATEGMPTTACRAPEGTLLPPTAGCQQQEVHQHQGRQQQWNACHNRQGCNCRNPANSRDSNNSKDVSNSRKKLILSIVQ